ncbi:hypothetical protein ACFLTX_02595 [Chloroflexota bacterium]
MELDTFNQLVLQVHGRKRLEPDERDYIREELPAVMGGLKQIDRIREWDHPAGVRIKGAPVRSYLAAYGLLLGKKAFGTKKFIGQRFFDDMENRLTMGVMRANFVHGQARGFYCCKICSMAILPLFEYNMLAYLPNKELGSNLRGMIERREGRFSGGMPEKLTHFSLSF